MRGEAHNRTTVISKQLPKISFLVALEGENKQEKISFSSSPSRARKDAEIVAKFMHLDIHDASEAGVLEEGVIVREARYLDESIRERARRLWERVDVPAKPSEMYSTIEEKGHQLEVIIPPSSRLAPVLIFFLVISIIPIGIFGFIVYAFRSNTFLLIILGVGCLGGIVRTLWILVSRHKKTVIIRASTDGLEVEEKTLFVTTWTSIPMTALEEFRIRSSSTPDYHRHGLRSFSSPIIARSDEVALAFAHYLPIREKLYVVARIRRALCE